jgi:hypothetical protein
VQTQTTSTTAIVSLVLGVVSWALCCGCLTGIPALIAGYMARNEIKADPSKTGDGLAIAGMVLGGLSLGLTLLWFFAGLGSALGR